VGHIGRVMQSQLLERFLREEATEHVRQLLLRRLSECKTGAATGKRAFAFNRFNVTIDCDGKHVTLEDDLDVGLSGKASWPLDEFISTLWR
jgi:hypothetical protein